MSDYIKREDAINVFDWGMPDADVKCGIAIQNIKDIPSADVRKNVHAEKIISGGEHDGATCWFECSHCHGSVDIDDAYCKHCGADMRGEE